MQTEDHTQDHGPNQPYCNNCGYSLVGLTESSKCPECGRPLVEVLMRDNLLVGRSRRYVSKRKVFGLPLIAIAQGPAKGERIGKPVGFIAIGDFPRGVFAIGGCSVGLFSFGGCAAGLFSFGGLSLGGILAIGGVACGLVSVGGMAIGGWAVGGLCRYFIKAIGGQGIPLLP